MPADTTPLAFLHLLPFIGFAVFALKRLLTYLHLYQQDEYDTPRFTGWIVRHGLFDKRISLLIAALFIAHMFVGGTWWQPVLAAGFAAAAWIEKNPAKRGKKKLVLTWRARRIFTLAWFGLMVVAAFISGAKLGVLWWLVAVHATPFMMMAANTLWAPFEAYGRRKFWREAYRKVRALNPYVIGITGSFGKTSVKHILGHILETHAPTLWTPGSINTPMGNTRIIREKLTAKHKFFIVEMGAYGIGSIKRLCKLTPPDMAIITAIGQAHYERFKTLENVAQAKFELAAAAVAKNPDGAVITHADVLSYAPAADFAQSHAGNMVVASPQPNTALTLKSVTQTPQGLQVELVWHGAAYTLEAPLYGIHHGHNMALAFAAACTLGLEPKNVITALKSTPQITHRLEVKPQPGGTVLIDDAYNSNPRGFTMALDVLDMLAAQNKGRRILVTPGMVELGAAHDAEHAAMATRALEKTDIVLAVSPRRIRTFVAGYSNHAAEHQHIVQCHTFADAQKWLGENLKQGDVVLLENDLPDLYERRPIL